MDLVFEPDVQDVVAAVQHMILHRKCEASPAVGPVADHLRRSLSVPAVPIWWLPERGTLVTITNAKKIPIQIIRDLWAVLTQDRADTIPIQTVELVSLHPIAAISATQPALVVLPWMTVMLRPMDHVLVPPHRLVTDCPWPKSVLPRLMRTDAVAQYLGLRSGEVVCIRRAADDPQRMHDYYRIIV